MIPFASLLLLSSSLSSVVAYAIPPPEQLPIRVHGTFGHFFSSQPKPSLSPFEQWLHDEKQIALDRLLANIAPGGSNARSAAPGSVLASPSTEHPNYYYHWVRDGAITLSTLLPYLDSSSDLSNHILDIFQSYNHLTYRLQRTSNPSGRFTDLSSLGEPKFEASGAPFTGSWGRPQRDGPPLRAITLMNFLKTYNSTYPSQWDSNVGIEWYNTFYTSKMPDMLPNSTIKADLEYVARYWGSKGFDLWEEVCGMHFFTAMVQLRALRDGAKFADVFGDPGAASWYSTQAAQLQDFVHTFWDSENNHLISIKDTSRSGLDCSLLLGSLHGTTEDDDAMSPFPPHSPEVLLSLQALLKDQRSRFPINAAPEPESAQDPLRAAGIGRYPEDAYNGYESVPGTGNPWFLCTSSAAEVLYRTHNKLARTGSLRVTQRGLPFWQALAWNQTSGTATDLQPGEYGCDSGFSSESCDMYRYMLQRLSDVGDRFLHVVKTHVDGQGSMSEQFDRVTGFERGARDLTWSYGAFLSAVKARESAV